MAGDYSGIVAVSTDPWSGLLFLSIIANINDLLENPLHIPDLPLGYPAVLVTVLICFLISKFMKVNSATKVFGVCTLGYLEQYLGTFFILAVAVLNIVGLADISASSLVNAAVKDRDYYDIALHSSYSLAISPDPALPQYVNWITGSLAAVFTIVMAVLSLCINFIVKTVAKGFDALETMFSEIPFLNFFCETFKTLSVIFLLIINLLYPVIGYIFNFLIILLCCLLFKASYNASQYIENIYVLPLFRKIFGVRKNYPLIYKGLPKRVRKAIAAQNLEPDLIIPVYSTRKSRFSGLYCPRFQGAYLIHSNDDTYLYFSKLQKTKNFFWKTESLENKSIYVDKCLWYYEFFPYADEDVTTPKKKPAKDWAFVFSKDYSYSIDEVIRRLKWSDLKAILAREKAMTKAEKAALRRERSDEIKGGLQKIFKGKKGTN
ncbi:MAG: hypothetical protein K6E91_00180 [Butyrivibrio sp.]|nr:hypothetical protein [Butyrivibrio sp.]